MADTFVIALSDKTKRQRKNWSSKWLKINMEVTSKNIVNCTKILEYRNFENILYKIKCEWESQIKRKESREIL